MVAEPIDFAMRRGLEMVSKTKEKAPRIYQSTNFLQVDMDVVELLKGDWKAACLLGMILDMQQLSKDGWVYHSWPQWQKHHFSRAEVERCVEALTPLGLEIAVRDHMGRLTRHYHIDIKKLKKAIAPLQKNSQAHKAPDEAQPDMSDIHPVRKLHGATKLHRVEKLQGACKKVTPDPVEKLQGLQVRSDLVTKSMETDLDLSEASASPLNVASPLVLVAQDEATVLEVTPTPRTSRKRTATPTTEATPPSRKIPKGTERMSEEERAIFNVFQGDCRGLLDRDYGIKGQEGARFFAGMIQLFQVCQRLNVGFAEVAVLWDLTREDSFWQTTPLNFKHLAERLPGYVKQPASYALGWRKRISKGSPNDATSHYRAAPTSVTAYRESPPVHAESLTSGSTSIYDDD